MYTNKDILKIAMRQSAIDLNCREEDFLKSENVIVKAKIGPLARKYYKEPVACNLVLYGNNIVASVKEAYRDIAEEYIGKFEWYHCFETPNMHWLDSRMQKSGQRVCFMAEYFLPDIDKVKRLPGQYELKVLKQEDFADLYLPEWSNALCADRELRQH